MVGQLGWEVMVGCWGWWQLGCRFKVEKGAAHGAFRTPSLLNEQGIWAAYFITPR